MSYTIIDSGIDPQPIIHRCELAGFTWSQNLSVGNMFYLGQGSTQPHQWPELEPLLRNIAPYVDYISADTSFFHRLVRGSWISAHCHPIRATRYVCSYYPDVHADNTPLELYINDQWCPVTIHANQFIVFDRMIMHRVQPQTVDYPRICIALNF